MSPTKYAVHLPEHRAWCQADLILMAAMRVCVVLTTETSIWRDNHCVLCGIADSGGPLPAHEAGCVVLLARRALAAGTGS